MKTRFTRLLQLLFLAALPVLGVRAPGVRAQGHDLPSDRFLTMSLTLDCFTVQSESLGGLAETLRREDNPPASTVGHEDAATIDPQESQSIGGAVCSLSFVNASVALVRSHPLLLSEAARAVAAVSHAFESTQSVWNQQQIGEKKLLVARPAVGTAPRPRQTSPSLELVAVTEFLQQIEQVQCEVSSILYDCEAFEGWTYSATRQILRMGTMGADKGSAPLQVESPRPPVQLPLFTASTRPVRKLLLSNVGQHLETAGKAMLFLSRCCDRLAELQIASTSGMDLR